MNEESRSEWVRIWTNVFMGKWSLADISNIIFDQMEKIEELEKELEELKEERESMEWEFSDPREI